MGDIDLISTAILLLVAGHETTVNLITNGCSRCSDIRTSSRS